MNEPKYDEDGVNLGYLRRLLGGIDDFKVLLNKLSKGIKKEYNPEDDSTMQIEGNLRVYGTAKDLFQFHGTAPNDLNNATTLGLYELKNDHTHAPTTFFNAGILLVYECEYKRGLLHGKEICQIALIGEKVYLRYSSDGTSFTEWIEISNKYNKTVLYENTSGTTGGVTLTETIDNFQEIEILYAIGIYHGSVKVPVKATSMTVMLEGTYAGSANMVIGAQNCGVTGTSITRGNSAGKNINLSTNAITDNTNLNFNIYKVVGYK